MKKHLLREYGDGALKRVKDLDIILKRADRYMWMCLRVTADRLTCTRDRE